MTLDETRDWLRSKTGKTWDRKREAALLMLADAGATDAEVERERARQADEFEEWLSHTAGELIRWHSAPDAPSLAVQ